MKYTRFTLIRQVIDETGLVDPTDIARIVEERTTDDEIRAWYRESLKADIRAEHLRRRKGGRKVSRRDLTAEQVEFGRKNKRRLRTRPQLVKDVWLEKIKAGVTVDGVWKQLADCSEAEVELLEQSRYRKADYNRAQAEQFGKLRAAMSEHGRRR